MADALLEDVDKCFDGKKQAFRLSGAQLVSKLVAGSAQLPDGALEKLSNTITTLELSETAMLSQLPSDVCRLAKLIELLVQDNQLKELPDSLGDLQNLRTLLANGNLLTCLPTSIGRLQHLQTLNISHNMLTDLPESFSTLQELSYLQASYNRFASFPAPLTSTTKLSTLILSHNALTCVPGAISRLAGLAALHLDNNQLEALPAALSECTKLKTVNLEANPYSDKKILKIAKEGKVKNILAHLKKFGAKDTASAASASRSAKAAVAEGYPFKLLPAEEDLIVVVQPDVKAVRPHIACALIKGVDFTPATYQAFITLQTTLHTTMCDKRTTAAIGTHDASRISAPLSFTAKAPTDISFVPLHRGPSSDDAGTTEPQPQEAAGQVVRADQLSSFFAADATMLKYLSVIQQGGKWAVLVDAKDEVLSLPPVINSEYSRMEPSTRDVLVEVTAPPDSDMETAKKVLMELLVRLAAVFAESEQQLQVSPVRIVSRDGHTRLLFPSRK